MRIYPYFLCWLTFDIFIYCSMVLFILFFISCPICLTQKEFETQNLCFNDSFLFLNLLSYLYNFWNDIFKYHYYYYYSYYCMHNSLFLLIFVYFTEDSKTNSRSFCNGPFQTVFLCLLIYITCSKNNLQQI